MAVTDDGLLHLQRGVFRNGQVVQNRGADRGATRLAQQQRRLRIRVHENLLESDLLRTAVRDHLRETVQYRFQSRGELALLRRLDAAARHVSERLAGLVEHAEPGDAKAGVDAE